MTCNNLSQRDGEIATYFLSRGLAGVYPDNLILKRLPKIYFLRRNLSKNPCFDVSNDNNFVRTSDINTTYYLFSIYHYLLLRSVNYVNGY